MITTVTLNPSIDEAVATAEFALGETNRCRLDALDPGGKGINVSRVVHRYGRETIALGFVGGVTGQMVRAGLDEEHVLHAFDEVSEMTRLNVMIYEQETGRRTRLYLPGARVQPRKLDSLKVRLRTVQPGEVVVFGGSLAPGLGDDVYRDLVSWLQARGARAIVDTSDAALEAVLAARPLLIKPNVEEAETILGRKLRDDDAVLAAARELCAKGPENVVISQGAAGAIAIGPQGGWKAIPPVITPRSTVGSGDSMVAGLAVAMSESGSLCEGLRLGTAMGAATAMIPGTRLCAEADVERLLPDVIVRPLSGGVSCPTTRQDYSIA